MILSNPLVKSKPFLNELSEGNFLSQVLEDRTPPHPRIRSFFHKTDICEIYLSYQLPLTILTKIIPICIDYIKLDPILS